MEFTQRFSDRSQFDEIEMNPVNLCLKYKPPSIALYYTLTTYPGKKFMHAINVEQEIKGKITIDELYKKLITNEPRYWNPNIIPKIQIIRMIKKLYSLSSKLIPKLSSRKDESKLTVDNNICHVLEPITNNEIIITSNDSDKTPSTDHGTTNSPEEIKNNEFGNVLNPFKFDSDQIFETVHDDERIDISEMTEEFNTSMKKKIYEEMFSSTLRIKVDKENKINEPRNSLTEDDDTKYFNGFQRVYLEEMGQEVFMDKEKNLYDLEGNILGQADTEEESV